MKRMIFLLAILSPQLGMGQLQINELMPKNVSYIMDDDYNFSMWVEFHNYSESPVNLSDFGLSNSENGTIWHPVSTNIPAKGYHLIYCERDDRKGHAPFKLDPEGGTLFLYNKSNEIIDALEYPATFRNASFGRESDLSENWTHFTKPSPLAPNNSAEATDLICKKPQFSLNPGFYTGAQSLTFTANEGENIYYTVDNSEPTEESNLYDENLPIELKQTVVIRAKAFAPDRMPSELASSTYFINERKPENLRVVSISTDQRFLTNDTIGIYCDGTNGIAGNLQKTPKNFNQDWDRPTNFEFFDEQGEPQLNQELDIRIVGGGSRESALKSISLSPKKKFGNNRLNYDFFPTHKPRHEYKEIMMRNSGNDFKRTMMKDAFLQSMIIGRMEVDYQAYEPAVIFINGQYCGIENMRERSNKDFVFSNHGLEDDEVYLIEATYKGVDSHNDIPTDPVFLQFSNWLKTHPLSDSTNYAQAKELIDIDEFINYLILQIYVSNVDWPYNNVKMWKSLPDGKWRWILMDVEYSYSSGRIDHNSLTFALGENSKSVIGGYSIAPEWSTIVFKSLIASTEFRNKFIDRFAIHLSTTFEADRLSHLMDSMANRIRKEMPYHQARYGIVDNFQNDIETWRTFASQRVPKVLNHISGRFLNNATTHKIHLSSDISGVTYLLNEAQIPDTKATIQYFHNRKLNIQPRPIKGYTFKHWMVNGEVFSDIIYSTTLTSDLTLEAVFEPSESTTVLPKIYINEVMTSNSKITDENGETDDYIELYNAGSEDVNIGGWYISDKVVNPTKFEFATEIPEKTTIPAGGRIILWADENGSQGPLHLNFKLDKEGETVTLYRKDEIDELEIIDQVNIPALPQDLTWSRISDGSDQWIITEPTWNATNQFELVISSTDRNNLRIYPTLAYDRITIENAQNNELVIYDLQGKIQLRQVCLSTSETIDVAPLLEGIYLIRIGTETFKMVKMR